MSSTPNADAILKFIADLASMQLKRIKSEEDFSSITLNHLIEKARELAGGK